MCRLEVTMDEYDGECAPLLQVLIIAKELNNIAKYMTR